MRLRATTSACGTVTTEASRRRTRQHAVGPALEHAEDVAQAPAGQPPAQRHADAEVRRV